MKLGKVDAMTDGGAANLNGGTASGAGLGNVDGVRIPPKATHWRCFRLTETTAQPMATGQHETTGQLITEWPIAEFSVRALKEAWGPGDYELQFVSYGEDSRCKIMGKSRTIRIGAAPPKPETASAAQRYCEACGAGMTPAARFCSACGVAVGGAAVVPQVPPPQGQIGEVFALATSIQSAMQANFSNGMTTAIQMIAAITEQSKVREEGAIRRRELDHEERSQRERHEHEARMAEQRAFFERNQTDPETVVKRITRGVKEEVGRVVEEHLADREEEEIEEPEDEEIEEPSEPKPEPKSLAKTVTELAEAAKTAGPMVSDVIGAGIDLVQRFKGTNGAPAGNA